MDVVEELVHELTKKNLTISFMESASGGGFANAVTNVEGASEILKFSAVTYCNEFKMKMGVSEEVIRQYSVYSQETAREMAKCIQEFSHSSIGVGVTGKFHRIDKENLFGKDHIVFVSVYYKNTFYDFTFEAKKGERKQNKEELISYILERIKTLL